MYFEYALYDFYHSEGTSYFGHVRFFQLPLPAYLLDKYLYAYDAVTIHIPINWLARYPRRSSVFLQFVIGWGAQASP